MFLIIGAFIFIASFSTKYIYSSLGDKGNIRPLSGISYEVHGEPKGAINLPERLKGLPGGENVILHSQVSLSPGEGLMVKSVFAPLKLYVNGDLVLEAGQRDSYPFYMKDPPTIISTVPFPKEGGIFDLEFHYKSPYERNVLSLPAVFIGDNEIFLLYQFKQNGFSFLFSLFLLFTGIVMLIVFLSLLTRTSLGLPFLWLGLFALSAGIWVFGECDLSPFFMPYPSLLYAMSYLGLFTVAIPFLNFGLIMLRPKNKRPFQIMLFIHYISLAIVLILQFSGVMDFIKSLYWFHIITPLGFIVFAICLLIEYFYYHSPAARRFAPGVILLAISTIVELINYWFNLSSALTLSFQIGILAFVLFLGIASGHYMRQTIFTAAEKRRLEYEMRAVNRQLDLQRIQYKKLAENDALVKSQSHDIRHQLAVLKALNEKGEALKLNDYINTLIAKIPKGRELSHCENYAVNGVASYYFSMAKEENIDVNIKLTIPKELPALLESDLCVVVGNLFENAIEASMRISPEDRFIKINSKLNHGIITITVDNTFTGDVCKKDGRFISSKTGEEGTGISSVKAVAKKYNGGVKFEIKDNVFFASVYINIELRHY